MNVIYTYKDLGCRPEFVYLAHAILRQIPPR